MDSTNDEAVRELAAGRPAPFAAPRAAANAAAAGASGATWHSAENGNLYAQLRLPSPRGPRAGCQTFTLWMGVNVCELIVNFTHLTPGLKWPNDLVFDTWKYALEAAEKNASVDNATVLMCSDLPESDHMPLPVGDAMKDSTFFAPLTYYKLSVPVVGLPRSLNDEAIRVASSFVLDAAERRERFLAITYQASYPTLKWIIYDAAATHNVRKVGIFDGIAVLEFTPR